MDILSALNNGIGKGIVDSPLRIHPGISLNEQLQTADRRPVNSYELSLITPAPKREGTLDDGSMYLYGVKDVEKFIKTISGYSACL